MKSIKSIMSAIILTGVAGSALADSDFSEFSKDTGYFYYSMDKSDAVGHFNESVRFMADQLVQNRDMKTVSDKRLAIVNIVNSDNYAQTGRVGMAIEEHLMHEMHARGFKVIDFKMMPQIKIGKKMDSVLSRNVANLKKSYDIHYVLTGTYRNLGDGIVFNLRMISAEDSSIVSTAQTKIGYAEFESLNNGYKRPRNTSGPSVTYHIIKPPKATPIHLIR